MYTVYFLISTRNGKVYTGVTSKEIGARLSEHNSSSNQFTKQNKPFEIIYYENYTCKQDAYLREKFYKSGFGRQIRKLIIEYIQATRTRSSAG